ncbi:hypothetical protein B0H15DRAFT_804928 [Mycena belliarum]|uniref:Uncharacterized protein n=1 Tax=Mycena belliarum TaxID=1033014 RepID=A0AAD6TTW5_9AGAR|nr:hypothetical protein B0H15DRAFT_804928 [Mycena belliae]
MYSAQRSALPATSPALVAFPAASVPTAHPQTAFPLPIASGPLPSVLAATDSERQNENPFADRWRWGGDGVGSDEEPRPVPVVFEHAAQCGNEDLPAAPTLPGPHGHVDEKPTMGFVPAFPVLRDDEAPGRAIERDVAAASLEEGRGSEGCEMSRRTATQGTRQQPFSVRPLLLPPPQRMHAAFAPRSNVAAAPCYFPAAPVARAALSCEQRKTSRRRLERIEESVPPPPREPRAARLFRSRRAPIPPLPATPSPLAAQLAQRAARDCEERRHQSPPPPPRTHRARSAQSARNASTPSPLRARRRVGQRATPAQDLAAALDALNAPLRRRRARLRVVTWRASRRAPMLQVHWQRRRATDPGASSAPTPFRASPTRRPRCPRQRRGRKSIGSGGGGAFPWVTRDQRRTLPRRPGACPLRVPLAALRRDLPRNARGRRSVAPSAKSSGATSLRTRR